jgi:hypothetical protein
MNKGTPHGNKTLRLGSRSAPKRQHAQFQQARQLLKMRHIVPDCLRLCQNLTATFPASKAFRKSFKTKCSLVEILSDMKSWKIE